MPSANALHTPSSIRIGVLQICSTVDAAANLQKIRSFQDQILKTQPDLIFLPECFYSFSDGQLLTPHLVEPGNVHWQHLAQLARELATPLVGGSVIFLENGKYYNRSLNWNQQGEVVASYDKMHLFRCDLTGVTSPASGHKNIFDEGDTITAGQQPAIFEIAKIKIGLSICFDLRFPQLFQHYGQARVDLISVSSAFTYTTGQAGHWHTLLRARAIETQTFVVACNQTGLNAPTVRTYGHSLVISPWGEVLLDAGESEGLFTVELNLAELSRVRARMQLFSLP